MYAKLPFLRRLLDVSLYTKDGFQIKHFLAAS